MGIKLGIDLQIHLHGNGRRLYDGRCGSGFYRLTRLYPILKIS